MNLFIACGDWPTREPRWRWAVPLRLRLLRMTDLSAGECLVRLSGRAETPHSRPLRSLTSSSSSLQGTVQASLPSALASFVSFRSAPRFAASSTVQHLRFKAVCLRRVRVRTRLAALVSGSSSVLNPILTFRKPDAQSEIAPLRLHPTWHSR